MFARYAGTVSDPAAAPAWQLLNAGEIDYALRIRLAIRLAHTLSGGVPGILNECRLKPNGNGILLEIPAQHATLEGQAVQPTLEAMAKAVNRTGENQKGG